MQILQQILFLLLSIFAIGLFYKNIVRIKKNIFLGRDQVINDQKNIRWNNVLLLALGQKKMFQKPIVGIMHFLVYAGFIIINIEVLEIVLDGITGQHRLFAGFMGGLYSALINSFEVLALLVLVCCALFLVRRNIIKIKRLWNKDLNGWPKSDANYILITEIVLMSLFLIMNASDTLLQARGAAHYSEHLTGNFVISQFLQPLLSGIGDQGLVLIERICWWLHIVGIFAFLNYLPYSKHLHIIFAFPNAYYANLEPLGEMKNMPSVQQEVLYAMQPELAANADPNAVPEKFGAKDATDLSWKNLLDAYACTECGRCTEQCPANITGKILSPRKIMMDTRDRITEIGQNIDKNKSFVDDGKSLLYDYISEEELRACTTCNACVEACPVSISPLDIILQLRRYLVMEESKAPQEWNVMFSNVENNFAPWKFNPDDRDKWAVEMENIQES
ncbi:MAG: (Fe-S)-binding protein [Chitinophagaceae bacterium]|nr:MAG: (Fe-S)-binding protein [Chitinophagaceae bacterium]